LSHSEFEGKVYNGRNWTDAWTFEGMAWCAITAQLEGIFTRGVFLDVAAARGVEFLETGDCGCRTPPPRCRCRCT
jgi:hypothetical protein